MITKTLLSGIINVTSSRFQIHNKVNIWILFQLKAVIQSPARAL